MKKKSISELIHFFVRHPLQNSLQMKFWRWLISSADAEAKEEAMQEEWINIITEPDEATRRSWYEVRRKAGLTSPMIKPRWEIKPLLRIASMILIPLFSVLLSWHYIDSYTDSCKLVEYIVPMGEQGELMLPDGTKVRINSESSIIYPKRFRGDTRTVYLSGEANFDVHKDKKHPFIVKTSLLSVRALGTKFNVQAYSGDRKTTTTLENGKVQVNNLLTPDSCFILVPGEQLEYNHLTKNYEKRTIDVMMASGWTRGELNFVDCHLEDILNTLGRHYNVEIKAAPHLYTDDLYTIKLRKGESLQAAIHIVTMTVGGIESQVTANNVVILTAFSPTNKSKKGGAHP